MQMVFLRSLSGILIHVVTFVMLIGAGIMIGLPWLLKWFFEYEYTFYYGSLPADQAIQFNQNSYVWTLIFLYLSAILAEILLWQVRKLLLHVQNDRPFIQENVTLLRRIGFLCLAFCILYIPALFLIWSVFAVVVLFIFGLVSCIAFILSALFQKAILYKEENDMTI